MIMEKEKERITVSLKPSLKASSKVGRTEEINYQQLHTTSGTIMSKVNSMSCP